MMQRLKGWGWVLKGWGWGWMMVRVSWGFGTIISPTLSDRN